jgi:hypothetical protein
MQIIKHKEGGDTVYTVYRDGQKIATVARGWLRLGGSQWVANMAGRAPFGERTLTAMWRRIGMINRGDK